MKIYTVTCYSPPNELKIKETDLVEVKGWVHKDNIGAYSIENITQKGDKCICERAPRIAVEKIAELVSKQGVVGKVKYSKEFVQFKLATEE